MLAVHRLLIMELRVGNRYRLGRKIGSGSFGDIYLGKLYLKKLAVLLPFVFLFTSESYTKLYDSASWLPFRVFHYELRVNQLFSV